MAVPPALRPLTVGVPSTSTNSAALAVGRTMGGVVRGDGSGLHLEVGGVRVPLDAATGLAAGQRVSVEVAKGEGGSLRLRIMPEPASAPAARAVSNLVADTLRSLGLSDPRGDAARAVPAVLANKPGALRSLFSLFAARAPAGRDLEFLVALLQEAARAGALPTARAEEFAARVGQFLVRDEGDIAKVLRRVGRESGRSAEARLAGMLRAGGEEGARALTSELSGILGRLREDEGLVEFLRTTDRLEAFREAADGFLDKLAARDTQNLRSRDLPYLFVELPFSAEAPIRHACVHFWGRDGGKGIDAHHAEAALDLSTTVLGDLWVTVTLAGKTCRCTFRVARPESVEILAAAGSELEEMLKSSGHSGAEVRVLPWDGDRFRETVSLMGRLAGVDLQT